ncbi:aminopeptidase [Fibrobacter sp. UBA4309]|uniref:aminopeptidase n=1 Tax=Fibrobacter sp. UBA4309 TaxID=1946537 RepID=UPI0025B94C59|nr:aminopeptidase [Fibrobacter sp. UBA4309]
MKDIRVTQLAENLINNAIALKAGENILIETTDTPDEISTELVKAVVKAGGNAFVRNSNSRVRREWIKSATKQALELRAKLDLDEMKQMQAYIAIRGADNAMENCDIDDEKMFLFRTLNEDVLNYRVNETRWCVLRWPNPSMAQGAKMSTEAFEDFYFKACLADYPKMNKAASHLVDLMNRTDKVRLVAADTDLTFSIKGIPAVPCCGNMNIPDGEVYTAPVRNSVNGVIHYNTPTLYEGKFFSNLRLTFKDGKIVDASCETGDPKALEALFNTDEGARYVGEFAIGFNPYVDAPMCDILFDEKIKGSIHFTPGRCYEDAPNGNASAIHWDLVLIMRPEYGGGEIWFDDKLIRKDGLFVVDELKCLNPDQLGR